MTATDHEPGAPVHQGASALHVAAMHAHGHLIRYVQQVLDGLVQGNAHATAEALDLVQDCTHRVERAVREALMFQCSARGAAGVTGAAADKHDRQWNAQVAALMHTMNGDEPYGMDDQMRGRAL